ncbi:MAG TPA: hypothetical protein VF571_03620 [Pyrinomonadaceae bacterium]|jgi:hypothetical protein
MRSYSFYLLISIAAFWIGGLDIFTIYQKNPEQSVIVNKSVPDEKFQCQESAFAFILSSLKQDKNSSQFITNFIKEKQISNCSELFEIEKEMDLNNDGAKEQIIRAKNTAKGMFLCGATGNCSTWILKRKSNSYEIILDAGSIENLEIKNETTNGYKDLATRGNSGSMNHYLGTFKFNGRKYQARKCVEEVTIADGNKYFVSKNVSDCQ